MMLWSSGERRRWFRWAVLIALLFVTSPAATQPAPPTLHDAIAFERTICQRDCPSYRITLFHDGAFVWEGRAHVKHPGIFRGMLSPGVFAEAMATLRAYSFWSFERDYYRSPPCKTILNHGPGVEILVQYNGKTKPVRHDLGCQGLERQAELIELEGKLDVLLQTRRWVTGD